jgi:hypothetical protein
MRVQALSPLTPPQTVTGTPESAYGDTICNEQEIVVPTSTAEVAAAVSFYYNMQPQSIGGPAGSGGVPVKMRVVSRARGFSASDGYRWAGDSRASGWLCDNDPLALWRTCDNDPVALCRTAPSSGVWAPLTALPCLVSAGCGTAVLILHVTQREHRPFTANMPCMLMSFPLLLLQADGLP